MCQCSKIGYELDPQVVQGALRDQIRPRWRRINLGIVALVAHSTFPNILPIFMEFKYEYADIWRKSFG